MGAKCAFPSSWQLDRYTALQTAVPQVPRSSPAFKTATNTAHYAALVHAHNTFAVLGAHQCKPSGKAKQGRPERHEAASAVYVTLVELHGLALERLARRPRAIFGHVSEGAREKRREPALSHRRSRRAVDESAKARGRPSKREKASGAGGRRRKPLFSSLSLLVSGPLLRGGRLGLFRHSPYLQTLALPPPHLQSSKQRLLRLSPLLRESLFLPGEAAGNRGGRRSEPRLREGVQGE